ncbi:MAG: SRPBCC family protein, partial [Frankiaceae bacterium]
MTRQLSVTREIQAPAQQVWELVADVSRMGEWSPENAGAKWLPGVKGPQRGARFLGENRNGWR